MVSEPLHSKAGMSATRDSDKDSPGSRRKDAGKTARLPFLSDEPFPEFQTPLLHFPSSKRGGLRRDGRQCVRVQDSPSSQIAGRLNKEPIETQSLSLPISSGSVTGSMDTDCPGFSPMRQPQVAWSVSLGSHALGI